MPEPQTDLDPSEPGEDAPLDGADGGAGSDVDDGPGDSQSTTTDGDSSTTADGEGGKGDGGEGDGDAGDAPPTKKGAFDALLAKYGGDQEKLADGVWEQSKSLSQLSLRLDKLQETLDQAVAAPEQDVEAIIGDDPYVKEAADELRSNDARVKEAQQEQTRIIAEHGKWEKEVARLKGALSKAPPEERDEVRDELREARGDQKEAERAYRESRREITGLNRELRQSAQKFRQAESNARERLEREQQNAQTQKERNVETRQDFDDAVTAEAKKYGIPTDSQTFTVLHQGVKDRIAGYLRTLPRGAPGIDIPGAVTVVMEEFVEAMALKSRFQKDSTRKRQQTGQRGDGSGVKAPAATGDEPKGAWSLEYIRERSRRLLGG